MSIQHEPSPAPPGSPAFQGVRRGGTVLLVLGIVLVVLGAFAVVWSVAATWAFIEVFSIVLLVGSGAQLGRAVLGRGAGHFVLHLVVAVLYFVAGIMMLGHPAAAAAGLTLLLAALFMVGGLSRIVVALAERHHGWGWVLLNGLITLALGALIWAQWPWSSFWVIGLLVGIDMLFNGWSLIMLALALRGLTRPPA